MSVSNVNAKFKVGHLIYDAARPWSSERAMIPIVCDDLGIYGVGYNNGFGDISFKRFHKKGTVALRTKKAMANGYKRMTVGRPAFMDRGNNSSTARKLRAFIKRECERETQKEVPGRFRYGHDYIEIGVVDNSVWAGDW